MSIEEQPDQLYADISAEDELGVVLKDAIYIENQLDQLIEHVSCSASGLKNLNLDYDGKINLALVFGLDERFRPPLSAIGKVRNRFAHTLGSSITKSDVDAIYNNLAPPDKHIVQAVYSRVRANSPTKRPKSLTGLEPLDQFRLLAVSMRQALVAALHQAAPPNLPS